MAEVESTLFQSISSSVTGAYNSFTSSVTSGLTSGVTKVADGYKQYTPEIIQKAVTWTTEIPYLPHLGAGVGGYFFTNAAIEAIEAKANKARALAKLGAASAFGCYLYTNSNTAYTQVFLISALARALWVIAQNSDLIGNKNKALSTKEKTVYYLIPLTEDQKERVSKQVEKLHNRAELIEKKMDRTFNNLFKRTAA